MSKLSDKIKEIKKYLVELDSIVPNKFEEYESNIEKKAACERYFEKIVESAIDSAFLIIKMKKLELPEDDIDSFNILQRNNIIKSDISARLKDAKRMRNIIIHQYGKIDDRIVFHTIKNELKRDIEKFLKEVEKWQ